MTAELHADDEVARSGSPLDPVEGDPPSERERPNVSGDLGTVLSAAPMFRRTVVGYDRFQVDSYVQWAEDELATADREREHLVARHLSTRAALDEARELLSHSSTGGDFLEASRRIGSLLAAAADEAESMKAHADADRAAAAAEAERLVDSAERVLAEAEAEAARMAVEAADEVQQALTEAGRIVDEAEQIIGAARAEAAVRLAEVRATEQRAAREAALVRRQAMDDAAAARLQARDEVVRMLGTGRDERRRADAAAADTRERLDRDAAARRASLLAEVAALEERRSALRDEVDALAPRLAGTPDPRLDLHVRHLVERLRWRARSLRAH